MLIVNAAGCTCAVVAVEPICPAIATFGEIHPASAPSVGAEDWRTSPA
jgi:hypothetical protein